MRHPTDEALAWVGTLGTAYTGLGVAGTNAAKFSVRTSADAAYAGYDWTAGLLELAGGAGDYLILIPASALPAGRYVLGLRSANSGGKYVYEELIIGAPQVDPQVATIAGYVDTEVAAILARLPAAGVPSAADYTTARAAKLDNLDATITTRATPADVDVQVDADLAPLQTDLTELLARTPKIRAGR